jgi:predicted DNA-binding transcriptional regulator AlpA
MNDRKRRGDALPHSLPPIGLSREVAAAYIDVSPSKFDEMVRDGRMPRPRKIDARRIWYRPEVEAAFVALPVDGAEPPVDQWGVSNDGPVPARVPVAAWQRTLLLSLYRRGGSAPASTLEGAGRVSRKKLLDLGLIADDGETLTITPDGAELARGLNGIYRVDPAPPTNKPKIRAPKAPAPSPDPSQDSEIIPYVFTLGWSEKKLASKLGVLEMKLLRQLHPFDGAEVEKHKLLGAGPSTIGLLYARGLVEELGRRHHSWLAITEAGKKAYEKQRG